MWYDVLVLVVLIYAVMRGAIKGIVWQLATIATLLLCFGFSESLSLAIAPYLTIQPPLNRWVAMFGLYLFFSFISFATARKMKSWIDKAKFEEYDRHLGSVLGFVKGVIFVLVMTFFSFTLLHGMPSVKDAIFDSHTGKFSAILMDRMHPIMPDELHDVLEPFIHSLDRPELDLKHHAHHDDEHDPKHEAGHNLDPFAGMNNLPNPIEAPPFPNAPRRNTDPEPPPFDRLTGEPNAPSAPPFPDFFDPALPPVPEFNSPRPLPPETKLPERSLPDSRPPVRLPARTNFRAERDQMLKEVANVLANSPAAQSAIVEEIVHSLKGLPEEIQFQVVKDWYTDLLVFDPNADPDPQTDLSTSFDQRILRQLQQNKVPLSTLNTALKDRLNNTRQ